MKDVRRIARSFPPGTPTIDGYPIPQGGSGNAAPPAQGTGTGDGGGDSGGSGDAGTGDGDGEASSSGDGAGTSTPGNESGDGDGDGSADDGRAGGDAALRADLARERKRRQDRERELQELRQQHESDAERREREIREEASRPALRALRVTAAERVAIDAGAIDADVVVALLGQTGKLDGVEVDLDAEIPTADRVAMGKLVDELRKSKPHLFRDADDGGRERGGSDTQGGGGSTPPDHNAQARDLFRAKLGMSGGRR